MANYSRNKRGGEAGTDGPAPEGCGTSEVPEERGTTGAAETAGTAATAAGQILTGSAGAGTVTVGAVPKRIISFIRKHHVMTVATVSAAGEPWCANLFYSYIPERNIFVFTTETATRHGSEMAERGFVAASIVLETGRVGMVQGLQIQGSVALAEGETLKEAKSSYLKKFPYAAFAELTLWILSPSAFKLTDNRLGFGKKLYWNGDGGE